MRLVLEDLHTEPGAPEASDGSGLVERASPQDARANELSGEDAAPVNLAQEQDKWPLAVGLLFILVSSAVFWGVVIALLRLG